MNYKHSMISDEAWHVCVYNKKKYEEKDDNTIFIVSIQFSSYVTNLYWNWSIAYVLWYLTFDWLTFIMKNHSLRSRLRLYSNTYVN